MYTLTPFTPNQAFFDTVFNEWEHAWIRPAHTIDTSTYTIEKNKEEWVDYYKKHKEVKFFALRKENHDEIIGYISYIHLQNPHFSIIDDLFASKYSYQYLPSPLHCIFIEALLVKAKYRNQKFGSRIIKMFHEIIDTYHLPYIVETNSSNHSVKLYEKNDYTELGRVEADRENGDDTVIYIRQPRQEVINM